jgi:glycosyltransferase involved in cell wall biosynthesis
MTTLHGRLDLRDLAPLYREFSDMPVVSISKAQRKPLPWANWIGNVYHGLPLDQFSPGTGAGKYLAFLGRVSPEKRVDRAIEIASKLRIPLKIAAKVDRADSDYFEKEIKGLLDNPLVDFIGEIAESDKEAFLGNALACLMPIDWPEPFGIKMIESMACGTPVVAFAHGSIPEIITDGVNGFIVKDIDQAVDAVSRISSISRAGCRQAFEERFTSARMAADYVRLYETQISAGDTAQQLASDTLASLQEGFAS